ncbi:DUF6118 family protein [Sphingobium yanoikuyae]|uniref:DUF6118 family protein n=1 Tax=Sphingobium yanoikuyae TaxID=13690 RepID=UPI000262B811
MSERDEDSQERADPALAFERLRGEVSLLRHAVEALTTARESIDIPDYEPTLERTEKVLGILVQQIDGVRKSPAMTLTPENMGGRLKASVAEATRELRAQVQATDTVLRSAARDLSDMVASARRDDEQNRWLYIAGGGGLVAGLLLYALLAAPLARMMPASWLWPERMATRGLGEKSAWDAGQRLMQTAAPESWGGDRRGRPARRWQPRSGAGVPRGGRGGEKAGALHDRGQSG